MNEGAFIEELKALAAHPGSRGFEDDCAVIEIGGETLVLTHDMMVDGVHVLPEQDPADIAWKLVAVNLSDLAAQGADPVGVLLGHMLGDGDPRFIDGLRDVLDAYDVPLLGGDTVRGHGPRAWGLTAIGRATHTPVPSRSGTRPGDVVYVTGAMGAALAGFEALRDRTGAGSDAYRRPLPLLAEGRKLAPAVTAMMDVSDGLLLDAQRMAVASGATIALDTAAIPIALPEARRDEALRWGDDYQLLFTAPATLALPVPAQPIGTVLPMGDDPLLLDGSAPAPDDALGYRH